MKKFWKKDKVQFSAGDVQFIPVRSLRQLRSYQSDMHFRMKSVAIEGPLNLAVLIEKKGGKVLGYFRWNASPTGKPLVATRNYDTFPIERLDLFCLEIVEFQIIDRAWDRIGFKMVLAKGILGLMHDFGCDVLVVHYNKDHEEFSELKRVHSPEAFQNSIVQCDHHLMTRNDSYSDIKSEFVDLSDSRELMWLLRSGLEVWSAPILNFSDGNVSALLGYVTPQGLNQVRTLPKGVVVNGEGWNASVGSAHS